jgi:hypothetical protein
METTSTDLNTPLAVLVPSKIRHVGDIAIGAIPGKSSAANRHGIKGRKSRSSEENDENVSTACCYFSCSVDLISCPGLVGLSRADSRRLVKILHVLANWCDTNTVDCKHFYNSIKNMGHSDRRLLYVTVGIMLGYVKRH